MSPELPLHPSPQVVVFTDGACRGNPGPSSAGWIIEAAAPTPMRFTGNMVLGRRTNNEAEYLAATLGLRAAADLGARFVTLKVDSELLARQVAGRYQVKNARLLPLFMALKQIAAGFERFAVVHVRREFNSAADAQANLALDEQTLARAPSSA